jgi:ketosteroid isomerase-like protein
METAARTNTQVVQSAYAYFAEGNISALLNELTDDVKWTTPGPKNILPWVGSRKGKQEVAEFFTQVNENIEFLKFEPREFVAEGDKVLAVGYWEGKSRKTGKVASSEWVMLFVFRNGKVCEHKEFSDTYTAVEAFR